MCYTIAMDDLNFYITEDCYLCQGKGKLIIHGSLTSIPDEEDCPVCDGSGKLKIMKR